jgi:hypothetical protein
MVVPSVALAWWLMSFPPVPTVSVADLEPQPAVQQSDRVKLKLVTPLIVSVAQTFLDLPMGAERHVTLDGHRYVFVLEQHYHPPGFVGAPNGFHKGVTVYELR